MTTEQMAVHEEPTKSILHRNADSGHRVDPFDHRPNRQLLRMEPGDYSLTEIRWL